MAIHDIYLDTVTHDLSITNGDIRVTNTQAEAILQAIRIKLKFFAGEYFLDTSLGIPYFTDVAEKAPNPSNIANIFKEAILSVEGVTGLTSFSLDIDDSDRTLSVAFTADTEDSGSVSSEETI